MKLIRLLLLGSALICGNTFAAEMVKIEGGSYRPLYLKKETSLIKVKPFQLDKRSEERRVGKECRSRGSQEH